MKKYFNSIVFFLKIFFSFICSFSSIAFNTILFQAKKNIALMLLYSLLLIQIVSFFSSLNQINIDQKKHKLFFNETINQEIDLKKIGLVEVSSEINIKNCGEMSQDSLTNQVISRDNLINCALKNLALGNNEEYLKQIFLAKKLDPNWIGWKK